MGITRESCGISGEDRVAPPSRLEKENEGNKTPNFSGRFRSQFQTLEGGTFILFSWQ